MNTVEIPERLRRRPLDSHGRPLAWVLGVDGNGEPMQGVNDADKVFRCIIERRCGLCGEPLGWWVAFIGDDESVRQRVFVEPPMDPECARYALTACPYLAAGAGFEVKRKREGVVAIQDRQRPARMALYLTRHFEFYPPPYPPIIPAAKAGPPKSVEWI